MNQTASVSHQIDCQPVKDSKEFVDVSPQERNWKGIAISLLVIVAVCSLITMSVVVLTPAELPGNNKSRLTAADLYKPEFSVHNPEATWISDSEVVYRNRDGHVIKFNFASNETDFILANSTFTAFKAVKYSLSADLMYALFAYDVKQTYRYSYTASYIVYNIYTREVWELNPPEVHNAVLQHASWGKQGRQLIFIFENNIYYQSDVRSTSLRITSSGQEGVVYNGLADWLYEEEILHSHLAHWWSPDGERLAFLSINDTLVPNMVLPQFTGSTYPKGLQYPYPMAGQKNPEVKLLVVNLYGATHTQELQPPDQLKLSSDFYVTMVKWISNTHLAVRWVNRSQNASLLTVCDATIGVCVQRHEDSSGTWLSFQGQEPLFSKDRSRFFLSLPVKQGGQGDFNHITMFTKKLRSDKDEVRHLTSGDWEVTKIVAYDENNQIIYFLSTEPSAQQRHLYSVSTLGLFPRRCVTCGLKDECSFFDAEVSPDAQHAILHCKGPGVPAVLLLSFIDVNSYFILENNLPLRSALETKKRIRNETHTITNDNFGTNALPLKLIYPPDFSESFLYGLLLIVGSSPGGQGVTDEFRLDWYLGLVGSEQVIVARLDGRGSGFRGQRVLQQVHQRLGTVDKDDQIAALQYLVKLPFIDPTRVGVFGEDYGGYLALMVLKSTENLIQCAAVQAPITDWSLYASTVSERYLGSPWTEENKYQASNVLTNMKSLQGATLFLAHGTADANVHFQHSAELIKHLIKIGANYTMQIYPDEGHFLSRRSQIQLTHALIGYFRGCLLDASLLSQLKSDD
ncbi:inactive dipeptidyl peptidase 10-like isoform X1 [Gymnodraco acuticeps]|uniref:Inactive dipeptidyl peptidase 10-like isoform X1 n=1 Tax=Gymnodraco acuticeps TaxID=8218 RepID=A0A6P8U138_GYMAC|nr:inactive dipeptidyl peptidase 10-like isoform X1 [Gymnodraco acuticeps]